MNENVYKLKSVELVLQYYINIENGLIKICFPFGFSIFQLEFFFNFTILFFNFVLNLQYIYES